MKNLMIILALAVTFLATAPASAEDYSSIPPKVRAEIKAKCVSKYPDDYGMQHGCILLQSDSYLEVNRYSNPIDDLSVDGIPSAYDRAAMANAAYLRLVKRQCGIDVGNMPTLYRKRALASDRNLTETYVDQVIASEMSEVQKADKAALCAEAQANMPNFADDLKRP